MKSSQERILWSALLSVLVVVFIVYLVKSGRVPRFSFKDTELKEEDKKDDTVVSSPAVPETTTFLTDHTVAMVVNEQDKITVTGIENEWTSNFEQIINEIDKERDT